MVKLLQVYKEVSAVAIPRSRAEKDHSNGGEYKQDNLLCRRYSIRET
jgi:hypothetical protein